MEKKPICRVGGVLGVGLVVLAMLTWEGIAADWPQWRGPDRDNKSSETGLRDQWPEGGPPLVWRAERLGGGYTTPSIAGGHVYGMGYERAFEVVWALDEKSGELAWKTRTGVAKRNVGKSEGPRCTPTVDGSRLYTLSVDGKLHCLDRQSGEIVWSRHLKEDFGGKMMSSWGYSESPLVDGNKLICTPGGSEGTLLALDKKTGKKIWQTAGWQDNAAYSSAIVREWDNVRQYIQLLYLRSRGGSGTVVLIEATPQGFHEKRRFDQPFRSDKNSWPHPVIANGRLFLRDQRTLLCYDVTHE